MRDIPAAVGSARMMGEAVDLNHQVTPEHDIHIMSGKAHLLADRYAPAAQAYDEDGLQA